MEDSAKPRQETKLEYEIEKIALEKEKLTQEIRHLKRHLYLQYIGPTSALILGLVGAIITYNNGFWDLKREKLENQKLLLQIDIAKFTKQKDSIKVLVAQSKQSLNNLQSTNSALKSEVSTVRKRISTLSVNYQSERLSIKKDIAEIDKLIQEGSNSEALSRLKTLVNRLGIITKVNREFSDEFDPKDFK